MQRKPYIERNVICFRVFLKLIELFRRFFVRGPFALFSRRRSSLTGLRIVWIVLVLVVGESGGFGGELRKGVRMKGGESAASKVEELGDVLGGIG